MVASTNSFAKQILHEFVLVTMRGLNSYGQEITGEDSSGIDKMGNTHGIGVASAVSIGFNTCKIYE